MQPTDAEHCFAALRAEMHPTDLEAKEAGFR